MFSFSRNYPYSPHVGSFWFEPPPLWKFQFRLKYAFKTPSPSEFPLTLCGREWIFSGAHDTRFVLDEFLCFVGTNFWKVFLLVIIGFAIFQEDL